VITPQEKRRYVLKTAQDKRILEKIHIAEKITHLSQAERFFLSFCRTQLEDDWRAPLEKCLDIVLKNRSAAPAKRWEKTVDGAASVLS